MKQYFVTGTDTEVGKTWVSAGLLRAAGTAGYRSLGYKPVAAGCDWVNGQWVNEDALALQQAASVAVPVEQINPLRFSPPIAPHIAARQAGVVVEPGQIMAGFSDLAAEEHDLLLMEGAGGWRLPIGRGRFMSDVVKSLKLDVILVVGMRLGCLNHALLTAEAIKQDGLTLAGWIANTPGDGMSCYAENLATLDELMSAPRLGEVPYAKNEKACADLLAGAVNKLI